MDRFLSDTAMGIYTVLFAFVTAIGCAFNVVYIYNRVVQFALIVIWSALLLLSMYLFNKNKIFLIKNRYKILALCSMVFFIIQCVISSQLVKNQMYDCGYVVNGAIAYAKGGITEDFLTTYDWYLHHYQAQAGEFLIIAQLLKLTAFFGITDSYTVLFIAGHLLFVVAMVATFIFLDKNYSATAALGSLLFFLLFLPFWFESSVPYTDTFSVWAVPCFLLFASKGEKSQTPSSKRINYLIAAVLIAVGAFVKVTVLIVVIAFAIQLLVTKHNREAVITVVFMACGVLAFNTMLSRWKYSTVIDKSRNDENMPVTHWIMMGMQGDGGYNSDDEWNITVSRGNKEEKIEKNIQVIKERLENMGIKGYIGLLYRKTCATFGRRDAGMDYNYIYQSDSQPINLVYDIVLGNGRFNKVFVHLSQSFYMVINIFAVAGAALMLIKKDNNVKKFAPYVALIGFYMFMMLWESNCRQLVNQWSLYVMCASIGYAKLMQYITK